MITFVKKSKLLDILDQNAVKEKMAENNLTDLI